MPTDFVEKQNAAILALLTEISQDLVRIEYTIKALTGLVGRVKEKQQEILQTHTPSENSGKKLDL